jgi:hypothetical protein
VSGVAVCSSCAERPAIWRLNPKYAQIDLVEAMGADLDMDPAQLLAAATADRSTDTFCAICADELVVYLSEVVPEDLAKDAAAQKAALLARERVTCTRWPVEARDAWLDGVEQIADTVAVRAEETWWRRTPILVRLERSAVQS